jgi:hypothetical protein
MRHNGISANGQKRAYAAQEPCPRLALSRTSINPAQELLNFPLHSYRFRWRDILQGAKAPLQKRAS